MNDKAKDPNKFDWEPYFRDPSVADVKKLTDRDVFIGWRLLKKTIDQVPADKREAYAAYLKSKGK